MFCFFKYFIFGQDREVVTLHEIILNIFTGDIYLYVIPFTNLFINMFKNIYKKKK